MEIQNNNFIRLLAVCFSKRILLLKVFIISGLLGVVFSLLLPLEFRSYTLLMPPESSSDMGMASLLSSLPFSSFGINMSSEETDKLLAIIKSRTIMELTASEFRLQERYQKKNLEETVRALRENMYVEVTDEGTVLICTITHTPWFGTFRKSECEIARSLARDMAGYIVKQTDILNRKLKTENAKNIRIFIEKRFTQNEKDLADRELAMHAFQQKYGVISLPEQVNLTLQALAEIKAEIESRKIEKEFLSVQMGDNHPEIKRISAEIAALDKRYQELQRNAGSSKSNEIMLSMKKVPDLGLEFVRLKREVLIQEKIKEFIVPQFEEAKLQEAKDTPTLQVLDSASTPQKKFKPKRAIIVVFISFMSIVLAIGYQYFSTEIRYIAKSITGR